MGVAVETLNEDVVVTDANQVATNDHSLVRLRILLIAIGFALVPRAADKDYPLNLRVQPDRVRESK